jgi:hypothetical protein
MLSPFEFCHSTAPRPIPCEKVGMLCMYPGEVGAQPIPAK